MNSVPPVTEFTTIINAIWYDIDFGDGSNVSQYFTPEGTLRFDLREFTGHEEIDGVYAARVARGARVSRHGASNVHIVTSTEDTAEVVSLVFLYAGDGEAPIPFTNPAVVSDVLDRYERVDGRWLLSSRQILSRFKEEGTELAVPTK